MMMSVNNYNKWITSSCYLAESSVKDLELTT